MGRISRRNQVTLPADVLRASGLRAGEEVVIRAVGPGRVEVTRGEDLIDEFAGIFDRTVYPEGYLDDLRAEWR